MWLGKDVHVLGTRTSKPRTQAQRRLPRDEVDRLVDEYHRGASVTQLASEFEIHRTTVTRHLDRHGVTKHRDGLDAEQVRRAVELYAEGSSLATIAEHLGVYPSTIYYWLRKMEVTLRPRPGWHS